MIQRKPPFALAQGSAWQRGDWPVDWVTCPGTSTGPYVSAYRLRFQEATRRTVRVHVSADERYALYLDGQLVGRGSARGSTWRWHYESYDLALKPGRHVLVARVWHLGEAAPVAQMRVHEGFLLAAEGEAGPRLSTGQAAWSARVLPGYRFKNGPLTWGSGHDEVIQGRSILRGWKVGRGTGWRPVIKGPPAADFTGNSDRLGQVHRLAPNPLPPPIHRLIHSGRVRHLDAVSDIHSRGTPVLAARHLAQEVDEWQAWWQGGTLRVPPHTTRRAIVDLQNYYCLYPQLTMRGGRGARVRLHWAESLYETKLDVHMADDHVWTRPKGHRGHIEGKYFIGHGPTWHAPGGAACTFDTLWWQAGCFVEVTIQTGREALFLSAPVLEETRYPLELVSRFQADDRRIEAMQPVLVRGLQMCAHETYMDCPYWEQLMYVGDTRLQALCTYVMSVDDRLPRQALRLFDDSRLPNGLTQSRFPTANGQVIPPFSLYWISMLYDFMRWRGGADLVRDLIPGLRAVLHAHLNHRRPDGLVAALPGWNFVDWVPGWISGEPPGSAEGLSSVLMWQLVWTLQQAAEIEDYAGSPDVAALWRAEAKALATAASSTFWNASRGLMADNRSHTSFSEHAQCFALLSGRTTARQARCMLSHLDRGDLPMAATIYFSYYVLEALAAGGQADGFYRRLELWKALPEQGFRTPFEAPGHTRSDCHAWSSHPLYHQFASMCGIQPASPGFATVAIRPMPGALSSIKASLVHPRGQLRFACQRKQGQMHMAIRLPAGVTGTLYWKGNHYPLRGQKALILPA